MILATRVTNANGLGAAFPVVAESADGFAEEHGEFDYGLQALQFIAGRRECWAIEPRHAQIADHQVVVRARKGASVLPGYREPPPFDVPVRAK